MALDAVLDDEAHIDAALTVFAPLIRGPQWHPRVSPWTAEAHTALTQASSALRRVRRSIEAECGL